MEDALGILVVVLVFVAVCFGFVAPSIGRGEPPGGAYLSANGKAIDVKLDRTGWDLQFRRFKLSEYTEAKALVDQLNALLKPNDAE